jgi:hypothetical protein
MLYGSIKYPWRAATRSAAKVRHRERSPSVGLFAWPMSRRMVQATNEKRDVRMRALWDEATCCDRGSIRRAGAVRLKPDQAGGLPSAKWPTSISPRRPSSFWIAALPPARRYVGGDTTTERVRSRGNQMGSLGAPRRRLVDVERIRCCAD